MGQEHYDLRYIIDAASGRTQYMRQGRKALRRLLADGCGNEAPRLINGSEDWKRTPFPTVAHEIGV